MLAQRLAYIGRNLKARIRLLDDAEVGDDLLRHLVGSLFFTPASMVAAQFMAFAVALAAWMMTREWIFLLYAALLAGVGFARIALVLRYAKSGLETLTRTELLARDREVLISSVLNAGFLGMMNYSLAVHPREPEVAPLAMGVAVGFTIARVLRSSGRLRHLVAEVLAVIAPTAFGDSALPAPYGWIYPALLAYLCVLTFAMGVVAHARIIELYRANETNKRMARYDSMTGLFNRFAFLEALKEASSRSSRDFSDRFAVIVVDLDRFKTVNDTLGRSIGDAVIIEMGARLQKAVRDKDLVARLGGDGFGVLVRDGFDGNARAAAFAERIVEAPSRRIVLDGIPLTIGASVGVALFPDHGTNAEDLMKAAFVALDAAKHDGDGSVCVFDAAMQAKSEDARALELEIQAAIEGDQFEPWFQPIQNIETGQILGYEALARWRHPSRGIVAPSLFIPLAERNGAILAIGEKILEKACRAAATWERRLTVAVNLSPAQFRRPQQLAETVKSVLRRTKLEASRLYLEITESLLLQDTTDTREALEELARLGVRFSLDDFGAGYSSLAYIRAYPFSKVKIDKTFIDDVDTDVASRAIIAAVSVLAARLDLEVVAEGVETQMQHVALRNLGLTQAQGYLYGKPAPQIVGAALRLVASA